MNLLIITKGKESAWKDPLLTYLEEHIFWIALELQGEMIQDMATLFTYILDLKEEFQKCNVQYQKPPLFHFNYLQEGTEPITILIGYSNEQLIIKQDKTQPKR